MTSDIMDAGNGVYMISAHAAPIRGGATGATDVAYKDAQKFCAEKGVGLHAIVLDAQDRDVYNTAAGSNGNGGFWASSLPGGNANLRFRCGT